MSITVRILGDDSDLQKTLGDSTKQIAKYGAAAAAAGAAIATALTVQGLKAVDSQAKLARSLGTSVDSLKALQIAASDSGLDNMDASLKRLNRRLGAAEMGMGEAGKSVEALNLNLADLSEMDADERIATIADAVRDLGMSNQQAARHAQNLGFDQAEAAAFFQQGGDAIRSYRQEVQDLGLALSEVDAAKVEMANDAFSRMDLLVDGLRQQLAVESAPYLQAISEQITESVKAMGGLGQVAENTFDFIIKAVGFVGNAMRGFEVIIKGLEVAYQGWGVVATTVVNTVVQALDDTINGARESINDLIRGFNRLPGVDISELAVGQSDFAAKMQGVADGMKGSFDESVGELHELLMKPLPSENIEKWAEGVKAKAEEAAQAMADAQGGGPSDTGKDGGMTDEEKAAQDALNDRLNDRLERIRDANSTELELLHKKFEEENAIINEALENQLITEREWEELSRDQKQRHEDELTEIEDKGRRQRERQAELEARNKERILGDALSGLTTLMNSESRKMFEIGKAAAISQSLIATYQGASEALKLGWPLGPIAAAAITGAGLANVQAIKSQSFGGGGSGGSGGSSNTQQVNAQAEAVQPREQTVANISLQGDMFSRDSVKGLMDQMNELSEDGMRLRVM